MRLKTESLTMDLPLGTIHRQNLETQARKLPLPTRFTRKMKNCLSDHSFSLNSVFAPPLSTSFPRRKEQTLSESGKEPQRERPDWTAIFSPPRDSFLTNSQESSIAYPTLSKKFKQSIRMVVITEGWTPERTIQLHVVGDTLQLQISGSFTASILSAERLFRSVAKTLFPYQITNVSKLKLGVVNFYGERFTLNLTRKFTPSPQPITTFGKKMK